MESTLHDELQKILEEQLRCQNEQDLQGAMRLIHAASYSYGPTQQFLLNLFANYKLNFRLLDHKLLALDDDYAFFRFKVRSEKIDGPDFKDNITDSIGIFRNVDGSWKIWCQAPITFQVV